MRDVGDSVMVGRGRLSPVHRESEPPSMEPSSTPIVPAQRLLEIAGVLAEGAARMHEVLRDLEPAERDAVLGLVTSQIGTIVGLWTELVREVVTVETPAPAAAPPPVPAPGPRDHLAAVPDPRQARASDGAGPAGADAPVRGPQPEQASTGTRATGPTPSPEPSTTPSPRAAPGVAAAPDGFNRDELTGVLNRPAGMAALSRELERCRQAGARFVLGYLDVDQMGLVNETHGPRLGDELLRKVTAALRATLRSYDVILRFGGDEFLFSLAGADTATAEQRLRDFTVILGEEAPGASASVGFAELHPGDTLEDMIARAEHALTAGQRPQRRVP